MIDLHCHLLPGIDDGPDTLYESLELCRMAVEDGVTHAIATPHIHPGRWNNTRISIERDYTALKHALDEHGIKLKLGYASEVRLTDQIMRQVEDEDIPFYGEVDGYRVMLLEFPHGYIVPGSEKLVEWLLRRNIRPLIAHPERNKYVMSDIRKIRPFVDVGCWLQVTSGSVIGSFGPRAQYIAHQLLSDNVVAALSSDCHNARARRPNMKAAGNWVEDRFGKSFAQKIMVDNPFIISSSQFE